MGGDKIGLLWDMAFFMHVQTRNVNNCPHHILAKHGGDHNLAEGCDFNHAPTMQTKKGLLLAVEHDMPKKPQIIVNNLPKVPTKSGVKEMYMSESCLVRRGRECGENDIFDTMPYMFLKRCGNAFTNQNSFVERSLACFNHQCGKQR